MTPSQSPIYNLSAVIRETGLAADTLRAWERRYGVPMPKRTRGGHRLYSERDIHVIKWLRGRQAEGLSISRAVGQWNELVAAGTDPLGEAGFEPSRTAGPHLPAVSTARTFRDQWLRACMAYNEISAEQTLNQAFALYAAEDVVTDVIQAAMHEIGEMWQRGEATVQQEHFISSLTARRLDALIEAAPPPVLPEVIVLASPESELHSLPLQFLQLLLRRRGRRVVFLGADVPMAQLKETVLDVKPKLVVMAAQHLISAAALKEAAAVLLSVRVRLAFGGRVFSVVPELRDEIAGTFLGNEMAAAVQVVEDLLLHPPVPTRRSRPVELLEARRFRESRPQIEAHVQRQFARHALPGRYLGIANRFFGEALAAALSLGSVSYLQADIDWVHVLLQGQGIPEAGLREYLLAYGHAVRRVMGHEAAEIAGSIEAYAASRRPPTGATSRSPMRRDRIGKE
jgi:MerR family transcriptional regulator, light-induced transcriptional regulator